MTSWGEWYQITKSTHREYIVPWLVSNLVGLELLFFAIPRPDFASKTWGVLLVIAAFVNTYIVLTDPTAYHEFGVTAAPPMQRFIYSTFFSKPALLVLPIAMCQGLIGTVLLFDNSPWCYDIFYWRSYIRFWKCVSSNSFVCTDNEALLAIG